MGKLPEEKIILIYKKWNSWETSQIIEVGDRSEGLSCTGWSALIVVGGCHQVFKAAMFQRILRKVLHGLQEVDLGQDCCAGEGGWCSQGLAPAAPEGAEGDRKVEQGHSDSCWLMGPSVNMTDTGSDIGEKSMARAAMVGRRVTRYRKEQLILLIA